MLQAMAEQNLTHFTVLLIGALAIQLVALSRLARAKCVEFKCPAPPAASALSHVVRRDGPNTQPRGKRGSLRLTLLLNSVRLSCGVGARWTKAGMPSDDHQLWQHPSGASLSVPTSVTDVNRRARCKTALAAYRDSTLEAQQRREANALRMRDSRKFTTDADREADALRKRDSRKHTTDAAREANALRMRMKRAEMRLYPTPERTLFDLHASSGAMATANSRRLRTLGGDADSDDYLTAVADVRKDIQKLAHVTREDNARCVRAFQECAEKAAQMQVCGACGLRDFEETYTRRSLSAVPDDHWLVVNGTALARLENTPSFKLLRRGQTGEFEQVTAHRRDLHNLYCNDEDGRTYHLIREAVGIEQVGNRPGERCIRLCSSCNQGWGNLRDKAQPMDEDDDLQDVVGADGDSEDMQVDATSDSFDDLYWSGAPPDSIAAGHDYGRLATLAERKVPVDISTLERLVLAKVRCHLVSVQVVAACDQKRQRLEGHTICFPHKAVHLEHSFGKAAIKAALDAIRPCFVGPDGEQGKLESAALKIDDLRLRPEVLFNFLTIRATLHGEACPPPIQEVERMITECDMRSRLRANASRVISDAIVQQTKPSDIAGVRACAQSRVNDGDSEEDDDKEEPEMQHVGVIEFHEQEMSAVLNGLESVVQKRGPSEGSGGEGCSTAVVGDNPLPPSGDPPPKASRLELQRESRPLDDYMGDAEALYGAWWPQFILKRGVVPGKAVRKKKLRHLFCYYDNRFAHDRQLLFHLANTVLRHAANTAVSVTVKSKGTAFEQFKELVNDDEFTALLAVAKQNPKGAEARRIMSRVVSFINLAGKSIPWGSRERAFEMTKLIAIHRSEGPGSIFYSMAPDGKAVCNDSNPRERDVLRI